MHRPTPDGDVHGEDDLAASVTGVVPGVVDPRRGYEDAVLADGPLRVRAQRPPVQTPLGRRRETGERGVPSAVKEIRRRGSKDLLCKQQPLLYDPPSEGEGGTPQTAQLYDTPEEIRRRGSKDLLCKQQPLLYDPPSEGEGGTPQTAQLYDTPEGKGEGEGARPENDERPAGEYEQPWEWKKEEIVKALSD
ncbi:SH2 domain-containing adapter protein E [Acipenser ruthenus]|uniref:SH2 domain-containing adapter protein E n=1 Tax=Acipenser ruthenus TaxID=7906 RepID=A0A444V2Z8_ACIRT|nr:SH2 domain-containing adapter protein E [Acipenser ruthenus]